ncbi:MAG: oligosaccharide repeat unit polymerase [Selenomonas sp.]|nr:oligosaccharide repeat unit polymerase [Selenomonas sp.]
MLIYVLVLMLVFLLLIAYSSSGQDFFYPWVIAVASFLNSAFLAMLNLNLWQFGFHAETCLVIVAALLMFGLGAMLASHFCVRAVGGQALEQTKKIFDIPPWIPVTVFLVLLVLAAVVFQNMYVLSMEHGNVMGIRGVLSTIRKLIEARLLALPKLQIYCSILAMPTAVYFTYAFFCNLFRRHFSRSNILYLLPLFGYVPHIVLSTGRIEFLSITVMVIMMAGFLYQERYGISLKSNMRILSLIVVALTIFFGTFLVVGSFTWKGVSLERGPFKILSHYSGAQMPAFDVFLQSHYPDDEWIGRHTLLGAYGNLGSLGAEVPPTSMFLEFTHFTSVDTNVYTSLRRYIQDYGYAGMAMLMFLMGMIYTTCYHFVRSGRGGLFGLLMYLILAWPLFMLAHDDMLLTGYASTRIVYYMAVMGLWCFCLKRYRKAL